ncbi:hypothetical protein [Phytohabitans rumicis]|uniref:Uncharacterized protein n=1 Tax=Phytohabitans rumicis TaxID=1076125 RepID=A0A6V8L906_9ACTN|nr:hypothetical protein [Phytohabitans rumicis]GFJ92774.1 hypothetical protein Prum_064160 [Phytohabitans rumicis]
MTAAGAYAITPDRETPVPIAAQSPAPDTPTAPDLLPALATELPANEASGVIASRRHPGVYYWLRDGGPVKPGQPRSALWGLRLDRAGEPRTVRGEEVFPSYEVVGVGNRDWEALAIDDTNNLWIGELGANDCRSRQRLLRVVEPDPTTATSVEVAAEYALRFPDNPRDGCRTYNSEAMFWLDGHLYVFAKTEGSPVYRVDLGEDTATLVRIGQLGRGVDNISASSVSDDRTRLMVLDHERLWVYEAGDPSLRGDAYVRDVIARAPRWQGRFDGPGTAAVEGGTFARDSYDLTFVGEDRRIYYSDPTGYGSVQPCPEPSETGAPSETPSPTPTPQPTISST